MASKRMFSKDIVQSGRFLKMPVSSQVLYFHLNMNADDDGVVEAYTVLRHTGTSDDDLKVLVTKGYVVILNDDLVCYITDWTKHNLIRADRKADSIYKDLLMETIVGVKLIEPRERADVKRKNEDKLLTGQTVDSPVDSQWSAEVRLGKVRLGKVRLEEKIHPLNPPQELEVQKTTPESVKTTPKPEKVSSFVSGTAPQTPLGEIPPEKLRRMGVFEKNGRFYRKRSEHWVEVGVIPTLDFGELSETEIGEFVWKNL